MEFEKKIKERVEEDEVEELRREIDVKNGEIGIIEDLESEGLIENEKRKRWLEGEEWDELIESNEEESWKNINGEKKRSKRRGEWIVVGGKRNISEWGEEGLERWFLCLEDKIIGEGKKKGKS